MVRVSLSRQTVEALEGIAGMGFHGGTVPEVVRRIVEGEVDRRRRGIVMPAVEEVSTGSMGGADDGLGRGVPERTVELDPAEGLEGTTFGRPEPVRVITTAKKEARLALGKAVLGKDLKTADELEGQTFFPYDPNKD